MNPMQSLSLNKNEPQINTDERRLNESVRMEKVVSASSHLKPQREGALAGGWVINTISQILSNIYLPIGIYYFVNHFHSL